MKRELRMQSGRAITVYDNLLDRSDRQRYFDYVVGSMFKPDGSDTNELEHRGEFNIFSSYSEQDVENMHFLDNPRLKEVSEEFDGMSLTQARVNLSTLNDNNRVHIDVAYHEGKTLLYYPNLRWALEWGGMTIFTDDEHVEIEHCVAYKPGRIVVFDGKIPHTVCSPTRVAPSYRFSFVIQFERK